MLSVPTYKMCFIRLRLRSLRDDDSITLEAALFLLYVRTAISAYRGAVAWRIVGVVRGSIP